MRRILALLALCITTTLSAQPPSGAGRQGNFTMMNAGHIYGKVVDAKTNRGIDGASLQLIGNRFDSATKKPVAYTIRAGITQPNGDFDFDQLPVMGNLTLRITAIGYKDATQTINFGFGRGRNAAGADNNTQSQDGEGGGGGMMQNMMNMIDRDLGNIKLEPAETTLENVTVTSVKQLFEMGVDRKIFNVDRNLVSQGQTATEVMKQIPSLSVDIDGNVTMRNATPQLFIDGRPTTLTLDQIPADIIERVELLTNPSARFDASGGNAGILNIVLKKNKRIGYNGGLRFGVDSRGKINSGGDINIRQGKVNFFASGMYNQRLSKSWSSTERQNLDLKRTAFELNSTGRNEGAMGFIRGGFDYLADNRNTFTLSGNFNRGEFNNRENQLIDSTDGTGAVSNSSRNTFTNSIFKNWGTQFSYKHNFAKAGHEWTADANYNSSRNENLGNFATQTFFAGTSNPKFPALMQRTTGGGRTTNLVLQTDYDNPISENKKIEFGARVQIRDFENENTQAFFNHSTGAYFIIPSISANYIYTDKVYAAYTTYGFKTKNKKWSYQFGLRAESSDYNGRLVGKDSAFNVKFPISLFPSVFITNRVTEKADIQFNYSRRINRPNFFQLMPFYDYSDPQNPSIGNPALKPEFTNSLELSYNNSYKKGANFLTSIFFKHNTNLITRYLVSGIDPLTGNNNFFNSYINSNEGFTYGIELTNRMPVVKNWDLTLNFNLFNSQLTSLVQGQELKQQRTSWFVKMNNSIRLPKNYTIQLSGDYFAKTVLPQEGGRGGRGGGGGGMMWGGGQQVTAQGYIKPRYSFDIAIRKEWQIKGGNTLSANLSMNDFLRTQLFGTYSESPFFVQTSERRRDPQVLRLNLQWRFGKFDANLFKRRNNRQVDDGGGIMGGM